MSKELLEKIRDYEQRGLVRTQQHPDYPELSIFNYTQTCQFEKAWDDVTKACRGLVLNTDTGEIIAKPWPKFFNLQEHKTIPSGKPFVKNKMDGSLGIVFWYDDRWHICTRGSFTSDQAVWAKRHIDGQEFLRGYTHLFEIIYPENRIVVDYGDFEGLVYLESLDFEGKPSDVVEWDYVAGSLGQLGVDDLPVEPNAEGYVLYWPESDTRMKLKFDEYVRLHKVMTEYSIKRLWEVLSEGQDMEKFLEGVPDEFYDRVEQDKEVLTDLFNSYYMRAGAICSLVEALPTRKEQAKRIMELDGDCAPLVFKLLDGKPIQDLVWKKVKTWLN